MKGLLTSNICIFYQPDYNMRMDPRFKKQIIIISIVVLIIIAIAFAIYFFYFREAPTCSDNIQNQKEEGIDCGGPCQTCEIKNLKNIEILWMKALPTQSQNYDLLARVVNKNQNHGSQLVKYEFQIFDLNDKLIGSRAGQTFILPRQEKYITELKVPASESVGKVRLNISQVEWEKIKDYEPPELEILEKKYEVKKEYPIFAEATGVVHNSSRKAYEKIRVYTVLFSSDGNPLAINTIDIDKLDAGQDRFFSSPWYFEVSGQVTRVDMEAETNIFK